MSKSNLSVSSNSVKFANLRPLLMKHEILSPECDLFRVCLPRRVFIRRMGNIMGGVAAMGVGYWWLNAGDVVIIGLMIVITLLVIITFLSQIIEERILFIRGLGVQYTVINGFNQNTTNFYPFEKIKSFYIFESFDGLKVGHFFCIKLLEINEADNDRVIDNDKDNVSDRVIDNDKDNVSGKSVILFENMRPPVEFLKRVYHKFSEITT